MKLLAADCGGSRIKLGLIESRVLIADTVIEARASEPLEQRLSAIADCLECLCGKQRWELSECRGLLLALPVIISADQRAVTRTFGKYEDSKGFDFDGWAKRRLGVPVLLENDARAAVIGEWTCGAGRGVENLVMVTLGTGIGTAVICEGAPLRGRNGMAGNLGGHTATHVGAATCHCGIHGCLEAQVGTWTLPSTARAHSLFAVSALAGGTVIDYEAVFRHAAHHDSLARELRDRALSGWGALLVNLIHGYDPERIIIGGGIMKQAELILPALRTIVDSQATQPAGPVEIVPASLGDAAALLGAPWLFEHELGQSIK